MSSVSYEDQVYEVLDGESVLQCLHRNSVAIPSSCGNGICQSCLMRATEGMPPESSQKNLKKSLKESGYFLACICKPEGDLEVTLAGDEVFHRTAVRIVDKYQMNGQILRLRLECLEAFEHKAGQFINLHRPDGLTRSYSIATSLPDNMLEFHIEYLPNGKMSTWIHDELQEGDLLEIDGPHGDCYYSPDDQEQSLLLIGTGSGLAPLVGILHDALAQGHRGHIHLFHGVTDASRLYMVDELCQLAGAHDNVFYTRCISGDVVPDDCYAGFANVAALEQYTSLTGWRLFLCGHPDMVKDSRKKAFLAGASLKEIFSDPFEFSH